ncbi:hypothetical protein [Methylobacillus sp.]|uniref:hypothetical protein n=1 Tax=Methylobacillus sp. TaxID=56818 RepID=UPI0012BF2801|nr:hypothetical protein [Methylobacillus sp.]MPS48549.1 hypothetical protein [Methylobacillus sp.]
MSKIFNADALVNESRVVKLYGKEHPVIDMTVHSYLETMKLAKELENVDAKDEKTHVSVLVRSILLAVPTLTEEELQKVNLTQLSGISSFIRNDLPEELKHALEGEEEQTPSAPVSGDNVSKN